MPKKKKTDAKGKKEMEYPEKIVFKFEKSPNYSVYAISGAHGGYTPKGELIMNVFFERHSIPESTMYEIQKDGTLGPMINEVKNDEIIREVLFGLSMQFQTAISLRNWLDQVIESAEAIRLSDKEERND